MKILSSDACFFFFQIIFQCQIYFHLYKPRELHNFFSNGEPSSSPWVQVQFLIKIFGLNKITKHSYLVTSELCSEQFCFDLRNATYT